MAHYSIPIPKPSLLLNLTRKGEDTATFTGVLAEGGAFTAQTYLTRNAARRNETCRYTITIEFALK